MGVWKALQWINFDFRDANTVGTVASKGKSKATKAKSKKKDFDLIFEKEKVEDDVGESGAEKASEGQERKQVQGGQEGQ